MEEKYSGLRLPIWCWHCSSSWNELIWGWCRALPRPGSRYVDMWLICGWYVVDAEHPPDLAADLHAPPSQHVFSHCCRYRQIHPPILACKFLALQMYLLYICTCRTLLDPSLCWNDAETDDQQKESMPIIDKKIIWMGNQQLSMLPFFSQSFFSSIRSPRLINETATTFWHQCNGPVVRESYILFVYLRFDLMFVI